MAENEDGLEKSEEPTPKKIEDARKKGQVARSKELNTMVVTLAGVLTLVGLGGSMADDVREIFIGNLSISREEIFDHRAMVDHLTSSIVQGIGLLIPFFIVLIIAAIASSVALGGMNFSTEAMTPKLSKFNVFKGIKKMFSMKSLVELIKALLKFFLIGGIALLMMRFRIDEFVSLGSKSVTAAISDGMDLIMQGGILLASSLILIALIDVPYQIYEHNKQLKMTKQEVKDENKQTEGKPEVKRRIRQLQYEMSQRRMMDAVPQADVIVTNPTHYAVALKYDSNNMAAPIVLAKGSDLVAARIKSVANKNEIMIVETPVLARAVYYSTKIDEPIPAGLYLAVAQLLAYVFQINDYQKYKTAAKPVMPNEFPVPDDLKHD